MRAMMPVEIQSPVTGLWSFMNPPGHHPNAKDFVAVGDNGSAYRTSGLIRHLFWHLPVTAMFAWEQPVFAPFDAVICTTENNCRDRLSLNLVRDLIRGLLLARNHPADDSRFFLGNHVLMRSDDGVYALCAHLRKGSLCVVEGQRVTKGEPIAAVGNSGNTIQPHLHFQLMADDRPFEAEPMPFVLSGYERRDGGTWQQLRSSLPANGQLFRYEGSACTGDNTAV